jgi:CRISPR/Cas system CSM-associated protein Csm3 (group 7 of RAMP superfamily)
MPLFEIDIEVKLQSDLHTTGPGRVLPLVDRSIEVDAKGNPVIPAASFRGRTRAQLERLLDALGEQVCSPPDPEKMCPHSKPGSLPDKYCRACSIFGNAWRQTQVFFSDLSIGEPVGVHTRTGIGINRMLNTVEEQRLFVIEAVPQVSTIFSGKVEGCLSREDLAWLLASIRSLTHLGGGKGRGLGRVCVHIKALRLCSEETSEMNDEKIDSVLQEVFAG